MMTKKEKEEKYKKDDSLDYEFALEQANRWIESADNKTGVALSLISITFTLYAGFLLENHVFTEETSTRMWIIILSLSSFLLFAVAILFYVKTLIPRITKPVNKGNPFYYGEVAMYDNVSDFVDSFNAPMTEEQQKRFVLQSVYFNSNIALRKMKLFKCGLIFTILFFAVSVACIILVLFTPFPVVGCYCS